jgi:hypothetical protein
MLLVFSIKAGIDKKCEGGMFFFTDKLTLFHTLIKHHGTTN